MGERGREKERETERERERERGRERGRVRETGGKGETERAVNKIETAKR